jgi:hypothetical protein
MQMRHLRISALLLLAMVTFQKSGESQPPCTGPQLSEVQIKEIIARERAARKDLPPAFPQYRSELQRHGCYYRYREYGLPEAFHNHNTFTLNQRGILVDAQAGTSENSNLTCPDKVFTEAELSEIVRTARARRTDLPAPFANLRIRVDRVRCLYLYFEYAVPESRGNYQVFTIDPLGEVMEFSISKPY